MLKHIVDWIAIPLLLFVFAGLGLYHYNRLDRNKRDEARLQELAKQPLDEETSPRTDWPQWRGPRRDGASTETGLLDAWPKAGPKLLWEQKTGEGYSSMAVARGRVFTMFQDGASETVACWDAETGKEHWRFGYPANYINAYGNGPRATPTIDGDFVYTVGGTGVMHCLDAFNDQPAQRVIWKKDLIAEFKSAIPKWGVAFSPLVEDGRVFIQPGGSGGNSLAALDPKTGAVLWRAHNDLASYSSPMPANFGGRRQILFLTGERLVSVVPETGAELWAFPWPIEYQCNIATPIVFKDYVFISSGYGRGCALLKIEKSGDQVAPGVVFKNRKMRNHFSSSVRYKNHIYGFDDSILKCMSLLTGEVMWSERGFEKGSLLIADGHLIIHGEAGVIALAEATPDDYREKSRFQFSTQRTACWSVPVIANSRLYVRDQQKLACFADR